MTKLAVAQGLLLTWLSMATCFGYTVSTVPGESRCSFLNITITSANSTTTSDTWSCLFLDGSVVSSSRRSIDNDVGTLKAYAISACCAFAIGLLLISIGWLALCWPGCLDKRSSHLKAVILLGLVAVLWAAVAPAASEAGLRSGPFEAEQQLHLNTRYGTCFALALVIIGLHAPLILVDVAQGAFSLMLSIAFVGAVWLQVNRQLLAILPSTLSEYKDQRARSPNISPSR
ncbi:uncharacterized protein LMH87_007670 [Akanthomyces muscarius]|uniref:Uncharacterized protein n=1 Tax=Akanthomyces muscarius TaxID=2231603 RepID=A0A9W8QN00_AKAMU|nr:uncharacterized protein LMH87_007670 [Akanthomyces muscarius]KAJ4161643.1 hypothetical protein LMH87_007670 [Akanthomyces muscarius]